MGCKSFACNLVALLIVGLKPDTCLSHCLLVMAFKQNMISPSKRYKFSQVKIGFRLCIILLKLHFLEGNSFRK